MRLLFHQEVNGLTSGPHINRLFKPLQPLTRQRLAAVGVSILLAIYLILTLGVAAQKSAYFDETAHIISGYHFLKYTDYRVNTSNMILGQKLAALPLCTATINPPNEKIRERFIDTPFMDTFYLGNVFLYQSGNNPQTILFRGRLMISLLGVLAALGVFFWSQRLFGTAGGLISLGFLCICPTFISLGGIVSADMPVACFFLFTVWSYWRLLHRLTPLAVCSFGILSGLLLLSKMSSLAFGPVALILLGLRVVWGKPLHYGFGLAADKTMTDRFSQVVALVGAALASVVIVVLVIWAGYGFRFAVAPAGASGVGLPWHNFAGSTGALISFVRFARYGHWLPEAFLFDLANLTALAGPKAAFFLGETGLTGWLFYFPFTFLAKSNPAMIVGLGAVAASWFRQHRRTQAGDPSARWWNLYNCLPLLVFIVVFAAIACLGTINIGHRHILPLYPFLFILLGGLAGVFSSRPLWPKIGLGLLLAAGLASAVATYPNPLSYISPLVGGSPKGYNLLVDSSLDWGQELPTVKKWLDAHPADRDSVPYFSYFGSGVPEFYGIKTRRLFSFFDWGELYDEPLGPGTYMISATMLQPVYYRRMSSLIPNGISVLGPWCQVYEQWYQGCRPLATGYFEARQESSDAKDAAMFDSWMKTNAEKAGQLFGMTPEAIEQIIEAGQTKALWGEVLRIYDLLRFARLTHTLRQRKPNELISDSILVFRLSEEDIQSALEEPLPFLPPSPVIKGLHP